MTPSTTHRTTLRPGDLESLTDELEQADWVVDIATPRRRTGPRRPARGRSRQAGPRWAGYGR